MSRSLLPDKHLLLAVLRAEPVRHALLRLPLPLDVHERLADAADPHRHRRQRSKMAAGSGMTSTPLCVLLLLTMAKQNEF
jgi:hypothetical protein